MTQWREAFCVLCGLTVGNRIMGKVLSYHDNQKPFGVIKESKGRGTMKFLGYYGVEEDVDGFFPIMKTRFLQVVGEWLERKWITREEILQAMASKQEKTTKTPKTSSEKDPLEKIVEELDGGN